MPVVYVQASNCSVKGRFSTKSFTVRLLEAIQHPFYGTNAAKPFDTTLYKFLDDTPEGILRPAFEKACIARRTIYVFVDELQHVLHTEREKDVAAILDSLKCMASDAKVILVFVGAYPLLNAMLHSPHLLGRKSQIHFPRYGITKDDIVAFQQILDVYSAWVRLPAGTSSLSNWSELLYEGSFGCIGLLERWLRSALAVASVSADTSVLRKEHLLASSMVEAEMKVIASEIAAGEELLATKENDNHASSASNSRGSGNAKSHKPFQKKPRRYKVDGRL